jgi:nitronate monooxygenase
MAADLPHVDPALASRLAASGLKPLRLAGRSLLPVVQGGMGVGVSAHGLAGAVAREGAWARCPAWTCAATTRT